MSFDQGPIADLTYWAVLDHTPSNPADEGGPYDYGQQEVELLPGEGYSYTFDPIAPGQIDYHFEVRDSAGTDVLLTSVPESETLGSNQDLTNPGVFRYQIDIDPDQANEVGVPETFTAVLTGQVCGGAPASCSAYDPLPGVSVDYDVSFAIADAGNSVSPASPQITDANGEIDITVNSAIPQLATIDVWVNAAEGTADHDTDEAMDETSKQWVDVRISITPLDDANEVGTNHDLTITLEQSVEEGVWTPLADEEVSASLSNADGATASFVGDNSCTTDASGQCVVTINSPTAGTTTVEATWAGGTVAGASITAKTTEPDADKTWVDVRISITPLDDANEVGTNHDLTITLEQSIEDGAWTPLADEEVSASLLNADGATASFVGSNSCTTDASGQCVVTINSPTAGTTTVEATWAGGTVAGASITSRTTEPDADKTWVDVRIGITPLDDANEVGTNHDLTITLEQSIEDGAWTPLDGEEVSASLSNADGATASFVGSNSCTTDASGQCVVTINSPTPGTTTVEATWAGGTVAGASITSRTTEPDADKTWVTASIAISPSETNGIGEPHTFTVLVTADDGTGPDPVQGVSPVVTIDPSLTIVEDNCATTGTNASGQCTVIVNSDQAGTFVASASVTFSYMGVTLSRDTDPATATPAGPDGSGPATKIYVDGSLRWYKVDGNGDPLGDATFEICRTADRFGTDIDPDECYTVIDNDTTASATQWPDSDGNDGVFLAANLPLGYWTIQETIAPPGYRGDYDLRGPFLLDLSNPDRVISEPWVNTTLGRLTPTGTTCEEFVAGTASDFTDVFYGIKDGLINNTHPGVFFYYTQIAAPSAAFDVDIVQVADDPAYLFDVQNLNQVRLYDAACNTLPVDSTVTNGQATVHISGATVGETFIISVKYETGNIVGLPQPGVVHYDFRTEIGGTTVDFDADGLNLSPG
jgi:hypothetical protein